MSHGPVPDIGPIVLVGFMAAGKSTVGRRLAGTMGWRFVDFDEAIAERTGRSPGRLIREEGEHRLREEEAALTADLAQGARAVLAPGGGWVTRPELAALLGPGTVRVWLRVSAEEAVRRAEADLEAPAPVDRPLLGPADGRLERARALLDGREPLYAAADFVVDVDAKTPDAVVEEILRHLGAAREDDER